MQGSKGLIVLVGWIQAENSR